MAEMTRDQVIDRLARIMRDSLDPSYREAPPPVWAQAAAAEIIAYHQPMLRDTLRDAYQAEARRDALAEARVVVEERVTVDHAGRPNQYVIGFGEAVAAVLHELDRLGREP